MKNVLILLSLFIFEIVGISQEPNALLDSTITYRYSSATDSTLSDKLVNTYDTDRNRIVALGYSWDLNINDWVFSSKNEYAYDSNGNQISDVDSYWNSNDWTLTRKNEYTYDSNGNLILDTEYGWDSNIVDWVERIKEEYTFDSNGYKTLGVRYLWNTNSWTLSSKNEYTYDSNGHLTLDIASTWNSNDWEFSTRSDHSYDSNGNQILSVIYRWDSGLSSWARLMRREFISNSNGIQSIHMYRWDSNLNDWVGNLKFEYAYDSIGNQTLLVISRWDTDLNDWLINRRISSYYDSHYFVENATTCSGDSILWQGSYYSTEGTFFAEYLTVTGSDSIYELKLIVNPTYLYQEENEICDGDTYTWRGRELFAQDIYYDSLITQNGCDSVYELILTVNPVYFYQEAIYICNGESYTWHERELSDQGIYYDSLLTKDGCDSIYELNMTVHPTYFYQETVAICTGDIFTWHGQELSDQGIYYDSLITMNGCDSIYELNLVVNPTYLFQEEGAICSGDILTWRGRELSLEGIYYDSLFTLNGCDSIFEFNLTYYPDPSSFDIFGEVTVDEYQIVVYSTPANSELIYTWLALNGNILSNPSDNSAEIQWGSTGSGTVIGIAENQDGCKSDSSMLQVTIGATAMNDLLIDEIKIYPNPVHDFLTIESKSEPLSYQLMDTNGKVIDNGTITSDNYKLDFTDFPRGVYFLQVEHRVTYKIVKH